MALQQKQQSQVTVEILQMIDNCSKALTDKENEVVELRKAFKHNKEEMGDAIRKNKRLEEEVRTCSEKYSQLQS